MIVYKHTQFGWYILIPVAIAVILSGIFGIIHSITYLWILSIALFIAALLFSTLTVGIDDKKIQIAFGIGIVRKSFLFENIQSASSVRNRWWYGWGIRITPHGWLFNVSGLYAVELKMKNGKIYRIGTDEPQKLLDAIKTKLS